METLIAFLESLTIWHWWGLAGVLLVLELMTGTTYLLWPTAAAFVTGAVSILLFGWQIDLVVFAVINLVVCLPLHWLGLARRETAGRPATLTGATPASAAESPLTGRARSVAIVLFALVMSLNGFVFGVISVQLVPMLEAAGLATAAAVWVASTKGVAQFDPIALVKAHLGFALVDSDFFAVSVGDGSIIQLKVRIDRTFRRIEASIAIGFHQDCEMARHSNLSKRSHHQLDLPRRFQRTNLTELGVEKLYRAGSQLDIETTRANSEVSDVKEHRTPRPLKTNESKAA